MIEMDNKQILRLGDRVIISGKVDGLYLEGFTGTIVELKSGNELPIGIEFDQRIPDERGHNCSGHGREKHCRYATITDDVRLLMPVIQDDDSLYEISEDFISYLSDFYKIT